MKNTTGNTFHSLIGKADEKGEHVAIILATSANWLMRVSNTQNTNTGGQNRKYTPALCILGSALVAFHEHTNIKHKHKHRGSKPENKPSLCIFASARVAFHKNTDIQTQTQTQRSELEKSTGTLYSHQRSSGFSGK